MSKSRSLFAEMGSFLCHINFCTCYNQPTAWHVAPSLNANYRFVPKLIKVAGSEVSTWDVHVCIFTPTTKRSLKSLSKVGRIGMMWALRDPISTLTMKVHIRILLVLVKHDRLKEEKEKENTVLVPNFFRDLNHGMVATGALWQEAPSCGDRGLERKSSFWKEKES